MSQQQVIRLKPFHYIHILDNNTNVTSVKCGPSTVTIEDHQSVVLQPTAMVIVPPRHYCIISNPVVKAADNSIVADPVTGQIKLKQGVQEIRWEGEPFPLYPGELLFGKVSPLQVVAPLTALLLRAVIDFDNRQAGDEWLFRGPGTYRPRIEVEVKEIVRATVNSAHQALRIRAKRDFVVAGSEVVRRTGEEWLVREEGAFLPDVDEQIVATVNAIVLTDSKALHLRAIQNFVDFYGIARKSGDEWLITRETNEKHIPDVHEEVVGEVAAITLSNRQYTVVVDPYVKGVHRLGGRELRVGPKTFFLNPGEKLENGVQNARVLAADESLLLRARVDFDDNGTKRKAGDRWMVDGPMSYVPPVTVEIVEPRKAISLDTNEGIYVRDIKTGEVRAITGQVYKLKPHEQLWEKSLPAAIEDLLTQDADQSSGVRTGASSGPRDKTRVVAYRIPHNSATQIFDYKKRSARVVFGPNLIMLGPDESFTVLSLSGGTPKRPNQLNVIALLLGPRFSTDVVVVETSDHARLSLKLSYNWRFDVDPESKDATANAVIFSVPDFIGDACKAIASRVRGAVAQQTFDNFHKNSAELIRRAVFGADENNVIKNRFHFKANNLIITNIDIQSVEPVDSKTRDALQKSVQLAIEITTKSQEAAARHEGARREQEARGKLERERIVSDSTAESERKVLLTLQAKSNAILTAGQATADSKAKAEAAKILNQSKVDAAVFKVDADKVTRSNKLAMMKMRQETEAKHLNDMADLEIQRAQDLANIEAQKFQRIIRSVGAETLLTVAQSGPEQQAKLLADLQLKSVMVTDGNNPINLLATAQGLIGSGR